MTGTTATSLVVADWTIDAAAVVAACGVRLARASTLRLVVPAWLHGLDWVGDPRGSIPCAQRQLERILQLCEADDLHVSSAAVGDPDPISAICDAADDVDRILLFARGRHVSAGYPLSVASRAARLTGLPLESFSIALNPRTERRRHFTAGHCEPAPTAQLA
jgi:hypothetical protein